MDQLTIIIIWAVIYGIIGLITTLIWGIDAPKFITDFVLIMAIILGPMIFIISKGYMNTETTFNFLEVYLNNIINMVPGLLVGDTIGSFFGSLKKKLSF